jgi:uncharacterized repeat protein (TIGR03806 family)
LSITEVSYTFVANHDLAQMRNSIFFIIALFLGLAFASCKKDKTQPIPQPDPEPDTTVSVDLTKVPYEKLSDYRFFVGDMVEHNTNDGVLIYEPISSLFTDYALKKRYVWMPQGLKANYVADNIILDLPVGSAIIKTFYYDNMLPNGATKILETRLMIRKESGWIFAEYVWNDEQTEAYLEMDGMNKPISWMQNGEEMSTTYRIPSDVECMICHKSQSKPIPIGIKPQNLNKTMQYEGGTMNQLEKWLSVGYLNGPIPSNILTVVDYKDENQPIKERLRSYLDINCAHCHQENSHCDYRPMRLAYSETTNPENLGVCVEPDEFINPSLVSIIAPGNINKSMMHFRLASTEESSRMPLLGRSLVHQEGLNLLTQYIQSISDCD